MKKVVIFIAVLAIISCKNEPKDYVTFSGKITDKNSDSIVQMSIVRSFNGVNSDFQLLDSLMHDLIKFLIEQRFYSYLFVFVVVWGVFAR